MKFFSLNDYRRARSKFASSGFSYLVRILKIRIRQYLWRNSTNSPYLSGDSFAELCQVTIDATTILSVQNQDLIQAKSIFVYGDFFQKFIETIGSHVDAKVILVGNSDVNFDKRPKLSKSVKLFLAQNSSYALSDEFGVLPIGLENLRLGRLGSPKWYSERASFVNELKVLVPPMSPTNKIRKEVLDSPILRNEVFHVYREYLTEKKYFALTGKYRFILALEGNGYENHRVWESLYQNSFPIMLETNWSKNIKSLGLPILLVHDLSEISASILEKHLEENVGFSAKACSVLWTPYWKTLIQEKTTSYR